MSDDEQSAYRPNALVAPLEVAQRSEEVRRVNDLLEREGFGRPVGAPETGSSALALLPVTRDAREVVAKLRQLGGVADSLARQVDIDPLLRAATITEGAVDQTMHIAKDIGHPPDDKTTDKNIGHGADKNIGHGADKNIGHGADKNIGHGADKNIGHGADKNIGHAPVTWTSVEAAADFPGWQPVATGRRPMIALLDTAVATNHGWLTVRNPDDPIIIDAEQRGWQPRKPLPPPGDLGSHHGHGTFNAGVIRQSAPNAQVLSIRLMNDAGLVSEVEVIAAVEWLISAALPVDVVVMPFGRGETDGDNGLTTAHLKTALARLAPSARIVAAAGSDGLNRPTYPAAFATDPDSPVVSVGSGAMAGQPDAFSNYGEWVEQWADGKDVISVLPVTTIEGAQGYTMWSGTSFAAVRYAAELAGATGLSAGS